MITVATYDDTLNVDGDLSMTLENLQALLEIDVRALGWRVRIHSFSSL